MISKRHILNPYFLLIPLLGLIHYSNVQLRNLDTAEIHVQPDDPGDPVFFSRFAKIISAGHYPLLIDWYLIQALVDPDIYHVREGQHPTVYYQMRLITEMDPAFHEVYVAGGLILTILRNDRIGGQLIFEKGEKFRKEHLNDYPEEFRKKFWPIPWQIPFNLAYLELFENHDLPRALEHFKTVAQYNDSPAFIKKLLKRLDARRGIFDVAKRILDFLIRVTNDKRILEVLQKNRFSLEVVNFLVQVNEEFARFREKIRLPSSKQAEDKTLLSQLQAQFEDFLISLPMRNLDPWQGTLSLTQQGKITTSTYHDKVLGIDP